MKLMEHLYESHERILVFLSFLKIQKLLHEGDISYSFPYMEKTTELCDFASELLYDVLPSMNKELKVFEFYASGSLSEVILDYTEIPFQFGYEEEFEEIRNNNSPDDIEEWNSNWILCFSSSYLQTDDYDNIGKLYDIEGFPSKCQNAYMYDYIDNGYSRYTFEVWVMKLMEMVIQLAKLIIKRKKKHAEII